MNLFLRHFVPERGMRLMILSLILFAPIYIYFSRTVMIESTALFFGFCFLASAVRQMVSPSWSGWVGMLFFGIICALVEVTTFCAFCFPCLIYPVLRATDSGKIILSRESLLSEAKVLIPAYTIPLLAGLGWAHREDSIKIASPATEELTSAALNSWTFGPLAQ